MRRTLAKTDQQKLDEYLHSVRSVERRIAAIEYRQQEAALEKAGVGPSKRHATDSAPIEVKIPEGDKRSEYMKVMCDLTVLAFQDRYHACQHLRRFSSERCFLPRVRIHRQAPLADTLR